MPIKVAVLKETRANEKRVALVPNVVAKLKQLGTDLYLQAGAGAGARQPDTAPVRASPTRLTRTRTSTSSPTRRAWSTTPTWC